MEMLQKCCCVTIFIRRSQLSWFACDRNSSAFINHMSLMLSANKVKLKNKQQNKQKQKARTPKTKQKQTNNYKEPSEQKNKNGLCKRKFISGK